MDDKQQRLADWWIGRFGDEDLAAWLGVPKRGMGLLLSTPAFRPLINGGGRGGFWSRRLTFQAKHALAVAADLYRIGLGWEPAANIAAWTVPRFARTSSLLVDFDHTSISHVSVKETTERGGYREGDVVPTYVMTERSDIDLFGLFQGAPPQEGFSHALKYRLRVINATWVIVEYTNPTLNELAEIRFSSGALPELSKGWSVEGRISDRKTVKAISGQAEHDRAMAALKYPRSVLEIDVVRAVVNFKRRALGLAVDSTEGPIDG